MPATIEAVWTAIISMFSENGVFATGLEAVTSIPLLLAPLYVGVAGLIIGLAKRTLRLRRR